MPVRASSPSNRSSSIRLSCGIAKRLSPPRTISAGTMARVSGILTLTLVPEPSSLCTSTGDVGDLRGGRDAGREDEVDRLAVAHRRRLVGGDRPVGDRLVAAPGRIDAPAVVRDLDVDLAALVEGAQRQEPLLGLARRASVLRT